MDFLKLKMMEILNYIGEIYKLVQEIIQESENFYLRIVHLDDKIVNILL